MNTIRTPELPVAPEKQPREKRARRAEQDTVVAVPLEQRRWLTIKETAARYPFSQAALRHLVFVAEAYQRHPKTGLRANGFLPCIVRPAGQRKVLIDALRFEEWLGNSVARGEAK